MQGFQLSVEKQNLRLKLRRKRAQAFQVDQNNGALAASLLAQKGEALLSLPDISIIAGYIPIGSEIDPRPLMSKFLPFGAKLCLPEVIEKNQALQFRTWSPGDMLISGKLGTLQPLSRAQIVEPDLVFVPLLGLDLKGVRLGQGGGFYDRTLALLKNKGARAYGVAFDEQIVDDLPNEPHDQLLDGVITPTLCKIWNDERNANYIVQD